MELIATGDWHITATAPQKRTDDYHFAQFAKISYILDLADSTNAPILQPGDLFDRPSAPYWLLSKLIHALSSRSSYFFAIYGQHDLRYHSLDTENTPLRVLESASCVIRPPLQGFMLDETHALYGASWGEPIPPIQDPDKYNILLIHKMIVTEKLWEQQEGHMFAKAFLRSHGFDLVISGDNHQFFVETVGDRTLINCGSLMRSSISQEKHIPSVVSFNTAANTYTVVPIPQEPFSDVFDEKAHQDAQDRDERMEAFIEKLSSDELTHTDFVSNLREYFLKNETPIELQTLIFSYMDL